MDIMHLPHLVNSSPSSLPSIEFLSANKEYLLTHKISSLPEEFIERIGELQEHQYNAKTGLVLSFTHQVLREADKFVWLMSDHSLIDSDVVFDIKEIEIEV